MSFDLAGFFGLHGSANIRNYESKEVTGLSGNLNILDSALSEKLLALVPGQMIQGEIVSVQGNQIQLLLGNEMFLNAAVESPIGMTSGQLMSFQVKGNTGSLISLIPLSVNLTNDKSVIKALNEASLPVTDRTVEMVNTLMKEGMPIDKETLLNMNKELAAFPSTEIETIVQMERLKIPVTGENISQFETYKNYNHKISDGIADLWSQLDALLHTGKDTEEITAENPKQFFNNLLNFFGEGAEEILLTEKEETPMAEQYGITKAASEGNAENKTVKKEILNTLEKETFLSEMKEMGISQKTLRLFEKGQLDTRQLTSLLKSEDLSAEQLSRLFQSKEFGKLLKNELTEQMLLKPEQLKKEGIEEYYTTLKNQTEKLRQSLENTGRSDTPAAKSLQNLNKNVDFLNQLNQMFTYVQLPLKMGETTAHGDLYVYTSKKNLMKKDGNVSALLHLDMPHLGMVDVYVAMQAEKVSTKFYLQNETMLDFLEEHMDILTERLTKKGYQISVQTVLKEQEETENTIMQEMLKQDKNVPVVSKIAVRSFDVRA